MSLLRNLTPSILRRMKIAQSTTRVTTMPISRTPRDLDEARKKRKSNKKRIRNGNKTKVGRNAFARRTGKIKSFRLSILLDRVGWRLASMGIVTLFGLLLGHVITNENFFVDSIELVSTEYVPGDEIYRASGVHGINVFWINPSDVESNIESVPGIARAVVEFEWPSTLYVEVREKEPILLWKQAGKSVWVDEFGKTFPARQHLSWLLPIIVDDATEPLGIDEYIPIDVLEGARQLKTLRPNIELLHYDVGQGLSYQDGRDWRGYFGTGNNMGTKLLVYETLIENLMSRGIWPKVVSVVEPGTPFHRE